jgi:hypothetical protein
MPDRSSPTSRSANWYRSDSSIARASSTTAW